MPNQKGRQIVVDVYVKVALGKSQREWPFITCSDRAFTEVRNRLADPYNTTVTSDG